MRNLEPSDKRFSRFDAQESFLNAIRKYAPEVLINLRDTCFSHFKELVQKDESFLYEETIERSEIVWIETEEDSYSQVQADIGSNVMAWAKRFNLTDAWLIKIALQTLRAWCFLEDVYYDLEELKQSGQLGNAHLVLWNWANQFVGIPSEKLPKFEFSFREWDGYESFANYQNRLDDES